MTNSSKDNINSVGGSADGVATQEELRASAVLTVVPGMPLKELGTNISKSVEWAFNSKTDVAASTKYRYDPYIHYYGSGAFSLNPILGKFIFGNSDNEASSPVLKFDKSSSSFQSTSTTTTLGSKNIDTVDGYDLNRQGSAQPSSFFTPQKTWVKQLFPTLSDKRLIQIAFLEAIQVALLSALKGTKTEQILKETNIDLGTIIVDNQEIEDRMLKEANG